jgi:hypothetical protein
MPDSDSPCIRIRIIPVVELQGAFVSEPIEGASGALYARASKRHPDPDRRCQVFPHPDLESEETIQHWLADWPKARFDVFDPQRPLSPAGVEFMVQVREAGRWITLDGAGAAAHALEFSIAAKTNGQSAGSCPAQAGSIPAAAILPISPKKEGEIERGHRAPARREPSRESAIPTTKKS